MSTKPGSRCIKPRMTATWAAPMSPARWAAAVASSRGGSGSPVMALRSPRSAASWMRRDASPQVMRSLLAKAAGILPPSSVASACSLTWLINGCSTAGRQRRNRSQRSKSASCSGVVSASNDKPRARFMSASSASKVSTISSRLLECMFEILSTVRDDCRSPGARLCTNVQLWISPRSPLHVPSRMGFDRLRRERVRMTTQVDLQGRVRVPADLDSVTAIGDEDHSGIDPTAVERIWQAARHWYAAGMHPAIQLCLRHNGQVVLNRAIGHGWGNAPTDPSDAEKIPVKTDTPFCVYSSAKAITTTVVHMLVERGYFCLDDRVCDYLPTYTSHGKHRTTIRHVMTHSAGVPFPTGPRPDVKRMNDSEYARAKLCELKPLYRPGLVHIYHALTWGPLVREIVSAATGKNIRDILATEILDPLGFRWTNYGVAEEDVPLVAPSHATGKPLPAPIAAVFRIAIGGTMHQIVPFTNTPLFLTGVVPSSSTVSNAYELSRFAEIWRRGGEPGGVRVMQPETLQAATRECRRLRPDLATGLLPLRWGTGFMLGSKRFGPFGRNAPAAFGHLGLTNIAIWADPERGLAAGLISSGKPGRHREANRYPALLDS